jgi:hypothetical protein
MREARGRVILAAVLVALVGGAGGWQSWYSSSLSRQVPGRYTARAFDNQSTVIFRFSPDGAALEETYPAGAAQPKSVVSGRWRMSGRVLVLENGTAATAPVSLLHSFAEQFESPILGDVQSRFRLASADESGLVLDLGGGVTWALSRIAGDP